MSNTDSERRDFYRIADTLSLEVKVIDAGLAQDIHSNPPFHVSPRLGLLTQFQHIDSEAAHFLRLIGEQSRPVAAYLKALNRKVELIARLVASEDAEVDETHDKDVEISEGGLNFVMKTPLEKGTHVALRIVMYPSFSGLLLSGQVNHCVSSDNGFSIGVEFVNMLESDRQSIAKHILQKQSAKRREKLLSEGD